MSINESSRVWEGVYRTFAEVPVAGDVFSDEIWLSKVLGRVRDLQADVQTPLAASSATVDYALGAVAACAAGKGPLRILDFGGGLGTSYLTLRALLPSTRALEFVVVENERICELGAEVFADAPEIRFQTGIPVGAPFDIVHAGSSLHYVERWREMVAAFAGTGAEYLLFADVPAGDIDTFVTAQWFHGRRIPVWFWNFDEFAAAVTGCGFEIIMQAAFRGYYLERDATLPTSHFDVRHRLSRCAQAVFRRIRIGR